MSHASTSELAPWWGRRVERPALVAAVVLGLTLLFGVEGYLELEAAGARRGADNDEAVLELAAYDLLDGAPPRGAYSRFGWHHPGPLPIQWLALGLALGGRGSDAAHGLVALLGLACALAAFALVARRRSGGQATVFVVLAVLAALRISRYLVPGLCFSTWNPALGVLPLLLLWTLALESPRLGPWAPALATGVHAFVVQAHLGYSLIATLLWAFCLQGALRRHARGHTGAWMGASVLGVLAAGWWSLLHTWPNVLETLRFFRDSPEAGLSPIEGLLVAARRTQEPLLDVLGLADSVPLGLALFALQALLLFAQAMRAPHRATRIAAASLIVVLISACRVDSPHHFHQTFGMMLVGPLAWWPLLRRALSLHVAARRGGACLALALLALVASSRPAETAERYRQWARHGTAMATAFGMFAEALSPRLTEGPVVLLASDDDGELWAILAGVGVAAQTRGQRLHLDAAYRFMFGPTRAPPPEARPYMVSQRVVEGWRVLTEAGGFLLLEPGADGRPGDAVEPRGEPLEARDPPNE